MTSVTEPPWQEEERLRRLYVDEGLTVAEIGDRLGCAGTTISDWLNRHNIDTRDPDPPTMEGEDNPRFVTREELIEDYQNLADELGKTPSQEEYNDHGEYTWSAIRGNFDGMGELQDAAGLERHRNGRVTLVCEVCGEEYDEKHAKKDTSRFCSRECSSAWKVEAYSGHGNPNGHKPISCTCEWCGDTYTATQHKKESTRFCSQECMIEWRAREYSGENHPRWKDNDDYYRGPNWARQRGKARDRDGHECQHCGSKNQLQVHHIVPYESFDDHQEANRLPNLITLCVSCHQRVEWGSLTVQSGLNVFSEL